MLKETWNLKAHNHRFAISSSKVFGDSLQRALQWRHLDAIVWSLALHDLLTSDEGATIVIFLPADSQAWPRAFKPQQICAKWEWADRKYMSRGVVRVYFWLDHVKYALKTSRSMKIRKRKTEPGWIQMNIMSVMWQSDHRQTFLLVDYQFFLRVQKQPVLASKNKLIYDLWNCALFGWGDIYEFYEKKNSVLVSLKLITGARCQKRLGRRDEPASVVKKSCASVFTSLNGVIGCTVCKWGTLSSNGYKCWEFFSGR